MDYYKDYLDRLIINEENGSEFSQKEIVNFLKAVLSDKLDNIGIKGAKAELERLIKDSKINIAELFQPSQPKSYQIDNSVKKTGFNNNKRSLLFIRFNGNNDNLKTGTRSIVTEEELNNNDIDDIISILASRLQSGNATSRVQGFMYECLCFMHIKRNIEEGSELTIHFAKTNDTTSDLIFSLNGNSYQIQCKWKANSGTNYNNQFGSARGKMFDKYGIMSGNRQKSFLCFLTKNAVTDLQNACSNLQSSDTITITKNNRLNLRVGFFKEDNFEFINGWENKGFTPHPQIDDMKNVYTFEIERDINNLDNLVDYNALNNYFGKPNPRVAARNTNAVRNIQKGEQNNSAKMKKTQYSVFNY